MPFVEYLKSLIASQKVKEAIQKLSCLFTVSNPSLETTAIILSSEYNLLNTQKIEGVIDNEEFILRNAKLNSRVLELVKKVEDNTELYSKYIDKSTNNIIQLEQVDDRKVILFLCSNPENANIDLSTEIEEISQKLLLIDQRQKIEFRVKKDLRKKDFQRAILELDSNPTFLHFSGSRNFKEKNEPDGLKLFDQNFEKCKILEPFMMTKILKKFESLKCVFLNACNTTPLSLELSKSVPYIISMDHYVSDDLSITFSSSFYEAIAAGRIIEFSFDYAVDNLALEGRFTKKELKTPRLIKKGEEVNYTWHGMTFSDWNNNR